MNRMCERQCFILFVPTDLNFFQGTLFVFTVCAMNISFILVLHFIAFSLQDAMAVVKLAINYIESAT